MARISSPFNGTGTRKRDVKEYLVFLCCLLAMSDTSSFECYENSTKAAFTDELYFDYKSSVVENGMYVNL